MKIYLEAWQKYMFFENIFKKTGVKYIKTLFLVFRRNGSLSKRSALFTLIRYRYSHPHEVKA